jgi:heme exporter protein B
MFADDFADGALEQLALAPSPFVLAAFGKMLAHWLLSGLPLAVMSPVLGLQFGLPPDALFILLLTLLAGTPALSSIGAIGAALTLGLRGGGALLALLVLPLYIPVLVFGAGAVDAVMHGIGTMPYLLLLSAGSLASLALAPLAAAAALKLSLE